MAEALGGVASVIAVSYLDFTTGHRTVQVLHFIP
jgi:hypothetical protein